jgi:hypothetical protein
MVATSNAIAKVAAVVAGLGLVAMSFASFAPAAKALTADEIAAQIAALQAQLAALGGGNAAAGATFTMDLTIGSSGAEVTALQNWLISKGHSIPAGATGYFGAQTQAALAAFQAANGISPAAGYFGPITRAKVNGMAGGGAAGGNADNGGLSGGAGSVDTYELMASLNNEEVGEDEEDVEVAGLEVEADDGSDIALTAVRLVFVQSDDNSGDASEDFEDVVSEVSIWLDGEEVGRVDGDTFTDKNDYTKTISLDDAVIDAGETGELVVAVSGASRIDSDDLDSGWNVDFRQIRFEDADGASISEDPSTGVREFDIVSFASAADIELKISEDDDDINDARTIEVDANDDTDDVEVLSFTVEAEGDSDITIDSFVVSVTSTEATGNDPDDLISALHLVVDGDEVASETLSTADSDNSQEAVVFDDLDWTIDAGDTVSVVITADFFSTSDTLDAGDTVSFAVTEAQTNSSDFDAEDETGENLSDSEITGSASSGAFDLQSAGLQVSFVSASETVTTGNSANDDAGTFVIKYNVSAFGSDVYVGRSANVTTASSIANSTVTSGTDGGAVLYVIEAGGSATVPSPATLYSDTVVCNTGSGVTEASSNNYKVNENKSTECTLTVSKTDASTSAGGLYRVLLKAIGWATTDTTTWNVYDFNLDDFRTESVTLN